MKVIERAAREASVAASATAERAGRRVARRCALRRQRLWSLSRVWFRTAFRGEEGVSGLQPECARRVEKAMRTHLLRHAVQKQFC